MRRTLALAGAAVLTLGLGTLAGPASADTGITQQEPEGLLNEIAVDLDSLQHSFEGGFIEIFNTNPSTDPNGDIDLVDYELNACSANGSLDSVVEFNSTHVIGAGQKFLIAEEAYADGDGPEADIEVENLGLDQSAGGVQLVDTSASPDLVHEVMWGAPNDLECANFIEETPRPTSDDSINRASPSWDLLTPTPENSSS